MKVGDIIVFKGSGLVFKILSRLLRFFEKHWDGWGWHMAYITRISMRGEVTIAESIGSGVRRSPLTGKTQYRCYTWLEEVNQRKLQAFTSKHLGENYDVAVYFWTMLQYLILHFFNHQIPRLLDNRYTCWEFVFLMTREMGKPIQSLHRYPFLTDFLEAVRDLDRGLDNA